MDCDYTGPNYSPEDLRSVIDAMCKSLESSGQIDEHEHPSAYSTLLDTAKWMADARPAPAEPVNARLLDALKRAKSALVSFKFVPGCANCWEESDEEDLAAIDSAIAAAEAQQERLLQDMHDAGREVDRVMAEPQPDAGLIGVQWWLAELDLYGNPALADGAHSDRAGADKAMHLFKALHLDAGRRFAVARVELSEPKPRGDGVNHEAIKTLNDARREAQP